MFSIKNTKSDTVLKKQVSNMVGIFGGLSSIGLQNQLNIVLVLGKEFRVAVAPPSPKHVQSTPPKKKMRGVPPRNTVAVEYFTGCVCPP